MSAAVVVDRVSPVVVGRDDALELVARRWAAARLGRGHMLLVAGEPGIGKTRLMHEASRRHSTRSPRALAFPRELDAPGGLLLNLGDELARLGDDATAERLRSALLAGPADGDDARRRRILLGELTTTILEALATPALWRLEDLHWADELSLDVLERVAAAIAETPSMVIATYRTVDAPAPWLPDWRRRMVSRRLGEEIILRRLTTADTARMVEAITGEVPSAAFVDDLHRRSDGIPLHIEELLGDASGVPESIAEAVLDRVETLDDRHRRLLQAASVIGRTFDCALLSRITQASDDDVRQAMRVLAEQQLVVASQEAFGFRHSLICDAVYSAIEPRERLRLHAAVARAADVGDAFASEHFERAGAAEEAHRHAVAAAADAVRVSSHRAAAGLYERALRTAPPDLPAASRARLHGLLGVQLGAIDEVERAAAQLSIAIRLHRDLGDEIAAAALVPKLMTMRHLLGDDLDTRCSLAFEALTRLGDDAPDGVRAEVVAALSAATMLARRLGESEAYGREAQRLAASAGATDLAIDLDLTLGAVLVFAGGDDEGWALLERGITAAEATGLDAVAARGYRMLATSASVLVEYDRAELWLERGARQTAATENWNDHHYLVAHQAHVAWAVGEPARAEALARHALADGHGITTRITALTALGYAFLSQGDTATAAAHLGQALAAAEPMDELQRISPAVWGLAEAALADGDPASATQLSERGFDLSAAVQDAAYLFPFVVTGMRARLALGDRGAARGWLARCTSALRSRGIPGTLPAIDHAAGLLESAEGRRVRAAELLTAAHAAWTARRRTWEARLAESALASLDPAPTGPLTAREAEVARLMASGATNREIAQTLVIAPKTVSTHVEHILAKLGMSRRSEVAAWVATTLR
ncbi:AAA ATPase-like protein [Diaminobutyricimonas aerilata]|uniref:AAA ATPase-like protein n=1 Tax=Diaminobutyricimonas aerilata TaxID=1162967 RepID=A0A2M9CHI7_9MICO|nr:LuxR family transcriptional regulator [Diaminobutyricimonas aerilata]PJJ71381.1 AAA ATPase-like protein [Diaminobutyricimonas aerilata]